MLSGTRFLKKHAFPPLGRGGAPYVLFQRPHRPISAPFDPASLQNILTVAPLPVSSLSPMPTIPSMMVHFDAMKKDRSSGGDTVGGGYILLVDLVLEDGPKFSASSQDENCLRAVFIKGGGEKYRAVEVGCR